MNIELSCKLNETSDIHYLIYRITNNINKKYYIGQHTTTNVFDKYAGSGNLIIKSELKYGIENFTKTILYDFDNFEDMNTKEAELVQLSNCWPNDKMSYNLTPGGHAPILEGKENGMYNKGYLLSGENNGMYGIHRYGDKNPMYGKRGKESPNYGKKRSAAQKLTMSIAAKNRGQSDIRNKALSKQRCNTKHMYNPITYEGKFIKLNDIEKYKLLGWKLGKYKIV